MKDFEEMTEEEKEELLKQIENLPDNTKESGGDSFDLFTQSFNEISKTWSDSLRELDKIDPDYNKDENSDPADKKGSTKLTSRIRKKIFEKFDRRFE